MDLPSAPPPIAEVPAGATRPRWSVMIPVYNAGPYLEGALRSVLRQDPGPARMQVAVVDNASTDMDVRSLVAGFGGRVEFFAQPRNVGSVSNFNTCLEKSRGEWVHLLHADDRVLPGFYARVERLFDAYPRAAACFTRYRYIDDRGEVIGVPQPEAAGDGVIEGWLERIAIRQTIQYAAMAVRRSVYEEVGGFFGVTCGEDWEMWVRIASRHPMAYTPEVLAEYRVHVNSVSGEKLLSGQYTRDLAWVIATIQQYLPPAFRKKAFEMATRRCAHDGLLNADRLWRAEANKGAAKLQIREALRLHLDASLCGKALGLYARMLLNLR
jgi:glycosyltransferase involved in cell wall biosynthesis